MPMPRPLPRLHRGWSGRLAVAACSGLDSTPPQWAVGEEPAAEALDEAPDGGGDAP
jgi:hypothetical protein